MDDDPQITSLTAAMLESLEYKFDVAKNGAEAVQLYQRYFNIGRPYDAVILDITVVGGMGGEECFKHLRDCDPDVRAIISTGYDNDASARGFLDQGFCGYLTKPYRVADLGQSAESRPRLTSTSALLENARLSRTSGARTLCDLPCSSGTLSRYMGAPRPLS